MHNLDFLYYLIFWGAVIGGFVLGFYSGIVAVVAINKYAKKQKIKPAKQAMFWCPTCRTETMHEEYVLFRNEDGFDEKGLRCLECDRRI